MVTHEQDHIYGTGTSLKKKHLHNITKTVYLSMKYIVIRVYRFLVYDVNFTSFRKNTRVNSPGGHLHSYE